MNQELLNDKLLGDEKLPEINEMDIFSLPLIIPLQWFSDADADDEDAPGKTEQPTEQKLRKLREEGQVVKSQELIAALGIILPGMLLLFMAPSMLQTCVEMLHFFLSRAVEYDPTRDSVILIVFLTYFAKLIWPILAAAIFAAIFSNIVQVGFLFTTKPLNFNISRIVPRLGQFFSRIFSVDGIYNLIKSLAKILIIGVVSFVLIRADFEKLLNLQKSNLLTALTLIASIAIKMLLIAAFILLGLSLIDYMYQRWRFRERNKMTRHEIKEELKQSEADPQVQNRIRSRFRDLLRQNLTMTVPQADVVITNPTHFAIGIKYNQNISNWPKVIAIGADDVAARIKQIARENGIPIEENKWLARELYNNTNVGDDIPPRYIQVVGLIYKKFRLFDDDRLRRLSA